MAATMPATHFKHPPDACPVTTMISREMPPILLKKCHILCNDLGNCFEISKKRRLTPKGRGGRGVEQDQGKE